MSQYKPYLKYKDSGIEWIGQVPEHWEVKPFFALVTELNRKNIGLVESDILSLSYGNIIQRPETRNLGLTPESYETYQIVEPDEIVFRFTDLQNDKRSLRSAMVTQKGIITSAYMAVKTHGVNSSYFAWMMRSYDLCKVFYAMGGGLRQSLRFEDVKRLLVLVPPHIEQRDIANAINAETARIDALIKKKTRFIELLKEKRQALITHAVTKGLDPNVKMKDSGVEWIGQVPEHWEVKCLKRLTAQCQNGVWGEDPLGDGSDTLCIRVADFDRDSGAVVSNPSTYRHISEEHQISRLVSKGDILLEKSGGGEHTLVGANVRYLGEERAVCSNFVAVVKTSEDANSAWLNYLMASMYWLKINIRSIKQSTGIQNLDSEQYFDEKIAAPPLDEQSIIAATLDRETARIDTLVEKTKQSITLLKERRAAFITAAVTGQIDLRGDH